MFRDTFEVAPLEYVKKADWDNAVLYCFALEIDGVTGWRLPTVVEFLYLLSNKDLVDIDKDHWYWTSEVMPDDTVINLYSPDADIRSDPKSDGDTHFIPVRSIK